MGNIPAPNGSKTKMALDPHQVLFRPLVTEKGMRQSNEEYPQYAFEINPLATKTDVRNAVEELFDVKVIRVATQNRRGKPRRHRYRAGNTKSWKKAIVTLNKEHNIDFF